MFSFQFADVDVYLPQLLNMYIYVHDVAEALHPYLIYRLMFLFWFLKIFSYFCSSALCSLVVSLVCKKSLNLELDERSQLLVTHMRVFQ